MKRKPLFALLLLLALAGGWWRGQHAIGRLRTENAALAETQAEAARLAADNAELQKLRAVTGTNTASDFSKSELLKLRNELRQLRAERGDTNQLRAENERLATELKSGALRPQRLADLDGFVAKENWNFAGVASPEAALESFFWSLREVSVEGILQCMEDKTSGLRRIYETDPEAARQEFAKTAGLFARLGGYRVASRTEAEAGRVKFVIQTSVGAEPMNVVVRQRGNEWKVEKAF